MVKLTQSKINEVIMDIAGKDGLRLVNELKGKENISEFSLASKLKKDIKVIRNIIYKLGNYNLISSNRKKDKQKGWYIYYWTIIPENIKFIYIKNKKIALVKLKEQLQKEQTEQFYTCPKKCIHLDFDQAIDFEFRCPECGELLSQYHDPKRIIKLQKRINSLEKELKSEEEKPILKKKIIEETKKETTKKKKAVKRKVKKKAKLSKKSLKTLRNKVSGAQKRKNVSRESKSSKRKKLVKKPVKKKTKIKPKNIKKIKIVKKRLKRN
jgi:transcription initiation factor TFIIE subunit alpha